GEQRRPVGTVDVPDIEVSGEDVDGGGRQLFGDEYDLIHGWPPYPGRRIGGSLRTPSGRRRSICRKVRASLVSTSRSWSRALSPTPPNCSNRSTYWYGSTANPPAIRIRRPRSRVSACSPALPVAMTSVPKPECSAISRLRKWLVTSEARPRRLKYSRPSCSFGLECQEMRTIAYGLSARCSPAANALQYSFTAPGT